MKPFRIALSLTSLALALSTPLAHASVTPAAGGNLLVNGDFETGNLDAWTKTNFIFGGVDTARPKDGLYAYDPLNGQGDGVETISQAFNDVAGSVLTISAWVDAFSTDALDFFSITFNGANVISQTAFSATETGYRFVSAQVRATGYDTLSINSTVTPISARAYFDDVSVSVPEPGSIALVAAGLLAAVSASRRRVRRAVSAS